MKYIDKDEWLRRVKLKYHKLKKGEKKAVVLRVMEVLKVHRKTTLRLLRREPPGRKVKPKKKRGRKSKYGTPEFLKALKLLWKETNFMCSKLLKSSINAWLPFVEQHHGQFEVEVREKLLVVSAATIDRLLYRYKAKSKGGTKPGSLIRNEIPIQGNIWDIGIPGFLEADTVAHCGNSIAGLFIWSITMVDICTQWTECRAIWHKMAEGVVTQVKDIESHLPFEMLGFDCDNGSEFLNNYLIAYFSEKTKKNIDFTFTRSRPYHKNDNAHVEQKNWTHPRQLFGRVRLDVIELIPLMNDLYTNEFSLLRNHFYPTFKLSKKLIVNSRTKRIYEEAPKTPYQRVIESPHVKAEVKAKLEALHKTLDPIVLKHAIDKKLKAIDKLYRTLRQPLPEAKVA